MNEQDENLDENLIDKENPVDDCIDPILDKGEIQESKEEQTVEDITFALNLPLTEFNTHNNENDIKEHIHNNLEDQLLNKRDNDLVLKEEVYENNKKLSVEVKLDKNISLFANNKLSNKKHHRLNSTNIQENESIFMVDQTKIAKDKSTSEPKVYKRDRRGKQTLISLNFDRRAINIHKIEYSIM